MPVLSEEEQILGLGAMSYMQRRSVCGDWVPGMSGVQIMDMCNISLWSELIMAIAYSEHRFRERENALGLMHYAEDFLDSPESLDMPDLEHFSDVLSEWPHISDDMVRLYERAEEEITRRVEEDACDEDLPRWVRRLRYMQGE